MQSNAPTVDGYIESLPPDRKEVISKLRAVSLKNLPPGFIECMDYGMMGYSVPHSTYPAGYHCKPEIPLPFMGMASQKHFVAVYHMGIYAVPELMEWFLAEYPKHSTRKLDMGKSCIRFKKLDDIPYGLIGELCTKMTPEEWIAVYEKVLKK